MAPRGLTCTTHAISNVKTPPGERPPLFWLPSPASVSPVSSLCSHLHPPSPGTPHSFLKQLPAKSLSSFQRPRHQNEKPPFLAVSQEAQCPGLSFRSRAACVSIQEGRLVLDRAQGSQAFLSKMRGALLELLVEFLPSPIFTLCSPHLRPVPVL